jgi:hypothetical protein
LVPFFSFFLEVVGKTVKVFTRFSDSLLDLNNTITTSFSKKELEKSPIEIMPAF